MAKWPYNTTAWKKLRLAKLARDPNCAHCTLRGRTVQAVAVDHIVAIANGGHPFPPLDGLASLCTSCHSRKTSAFDRPDRKGKRAFGADGEPLDTADGWHTGIKHDPREFKKWGYSIPHGVKPSRIPVTLICGAPGSGKTTYANDHAAKHDTIIDLDAYRVKVGGTPWDDDPGVNARAFAYRSKVIHGLHAARWGNAWLIAPAPTMAERDAWCDALGNVTVVVLDPGEDECLHRIKADPARAPHLDRLSRAVRKWYTGGALRDEKQGDRRPMTTHAKRLSSDSSPKPSHDGWSVF